MSTQRLVRCDGCEALLYRVNTEHACVAFVEDEARIKPLIVQVGHLRLLFCKRSCMLTALADLPLDDFQSGWPVS
jgi:hypothetical protein